MSVALGIHGLHQRFGTTRALDGIELSIKSGEYVVLLGPSGCGKTTLLSVLGGFLVPDAGRVTIGDRDMTEVPAARRPTATMFQDYALFPHMTLLDNVGFGLRMAGVARRERDESAARWLAMVGLEGEGARRPHELSGGQRQRVALARALAVEPSILLLDEPLGALDLKLRRSMQDELKSIQRAVGTTFVHVTHDQEEAMAIADRIVIMKDGRIEDVGAPARLYTRPATAFSAGFMGELNRIEATRDASGEGSGALRTVFGTVRPPADIPDDTDRLLVCLRPEALALDANGDWSLGRARVEAVAFLGTHSRCRLVALSNEQPLVASVPAERAPAPGDTVDVSVNPFDALVYPHATSPTIEPDHSS